jgi:hypothetical protein
MRRKRGGGIESERERVPGKAHTVLEVPRTSHQHCRQALPVMDEPQTRTVFEVMTAGSNNDNNDDKQIEIEIEIGR